MELIGTSWHSAVPGNKVKVAPLTNVGAKKNTSKTM